MKQETPLLAANTLLQNVTDPRAPKADITNAGYLMGDVYSGDPLGPYGDPDSDDDGVIYGDVSTSALDTFSTLIGDADDGEIGAPLLSPKGKRIAKLTLAAGAGVGAGALIAKAIKKNRARKERLAKTLETNARMNTIANQVVARRMMGKIPRTSLFPFYQLTGATLNSYPLAPTEVFPADTLKYNLDRQSTETPFEVEIVNGTFAGVTWTTTATGVPAARYYVAVILTVGISVLTANPGTVFNVAGTLPTINGVLTIAGNVFSFTIRAGYYAKLMIFPWQLVTNKPLLVLGSYNNANPIVLNTTGLPNNASVTMIVPGSQHPWTIGMRNRLL